MDKLSQKHQKLIQALATLEKAIDTIGLFVKEGKSYNPHLDYEEEYRGHRDSTIQRFEYSVDLFWKYLKKNLEAKNIAPDVKVPGEVVRVACNVGLITEQESEMIIEMIKERNKTSYIYVEEIAEYLVKKIPEYYQIMNTIAKRL